MAVELSFERAQTRTEDERIIQPEDASRETIDAIDALSSILVPHHPPSDPSPTIHHE
jgi:uncharacterized membrane protein